MANPQEDTNTSTGPKPGKGQFKCFHCRNIFPSKEGDWHTWVSMEVHLCRSCEKTTKNNPERKRN